MSSARAGPSALVAVRTVIPAGGALAATQVAIRYGGSRSVMAKTDQATPSASSVATTRSSSRCTTSTTTNAPRLRLARAAVARNPAGDEPCRYRGSISVSGTVSQPRRQQLRYQSSASRALNEPSTPASCCDLARNHRTRSPRDGSEPRCRRGPAATHTAGRRRQSMCPAQGEPTRATLLPSHGPTPRGGYW